MSLCVQMCHKASTGDGSDSIEEAQGPGFITNYKVLSIFPCILSFPYNVEQVNVKQ